MHGLDALVRPPEPRHRGSFPTPVDATVTRATATRVWFTVPAFDRGVHEFGGDDGAQLPRCLHTDAGDPGHTHPPAAPTAGAQVVVVFIDGDVDAPRVLVVYP